MIEGHYTPTECHILPSLIVCAGKCEDCPEIHAWQIIGQFLWWGFTVTIGADAE